MSAIGRPALPFDEGIVTVPAPRPAIRTSEHAFFALGRVCLKAFLLAQFLSLTRLFFVQRLGEGVASLASLLGLLSVGLLVPAVLTYGLQSGSLFGTLVPKAQVWIVFLLGQSVFLFLYGWREKDYVVTAVAHDFAPYLVVIASVVLGSIPRVWRDVDRVVIATFAIGLVVNAVGMTEMTRVVTESFAEDRAGVSTVAYRTQGALAFWPLLFLTARLRRLRTALLVFAGVFFVLAQQILFQKRSPTFRIALFFVVFLVVLPRLAPVARAGWARYEPRVRTTLLAVAVVAATASLGLAPWLFQGQLAGLAQRISGERYSGGAAGMLTWENERFFEAEMFFRTLQPEELVFGRGFGGYFVPDEPGWGVWLDDVEEFGRRQLHVGGLMPFFKGGLALSIAYYALLTGSLLRGRTALREPLGAAAFFVVLLHALFLLQEGWFIMSVSLDLVMVGLCMGYLLSRQRGRRRHPVVHLGPAEAVA